MNETQNRQSRSADDEAAAITLRLLGPMQVEVAGVVADLAARKARALLAYLALRPGVSVPRETLAGLLWAERGDEQARASLRQTLSSVRKALGASAEDALVATSESVTLLPEHIHVDVATLERAADGETADELAAAAALCGGELLEGLSVGEASFEQWLSGERARVRQLLTRLLMRLVDRLEQDQRTEDAIVYGSRLVGLDPLQEQVHRTLMRLYMAQGRYDAALTQFELCRAELAEQLDVQPEQATLDLVAEIRARRRRVGSSTPASPKVERRPVAPSPPLAVPDKASIAVLPFANLSGDPEQEFFSDGVSEDIITELSRFSELFVIARNSTFAFKGESVDVREVGRALGVRYILEGSVRKAGNRVRIAAQVVDASTADHIWADRYDREISDIFAVQDDISRTIVSTIAGRIGHSYARSSAQKPTDNLSAYECVLRGQQFLHKYTREDYAEARGFFEQAIVLDPGFARAYGSLACVELYDWFWDMSPGGPDRALLTGERGLRLDDHDDRCHLALGVSCLFRSEHDRAEHHLLRASSLNPNDDLIMVETGRFKMYTGAPDEGAELVRRGMRQNPYHPNWHWNILARCLHTAGRYAEAIAALEHIETPQFWNHAYLAACHAELGDAEEAKKHTAAVLEMRPDFGIARFSEILPYRDPQVKNDYLAGFRRAGLPE